MGKASKQPVSTEDQVADFVRVRDVDSEEAAGVARIELIIRDPDILVDTGTAEIEALCAAVNDIVADEESSRDLPLRYA